MSKKSVAIVGFGLIGRAIHQMLQGSTNISPTPFDIRPIPGVFQIAGTDDDFHRIASEYDAIVVATPYTSNIAIADACGYFNTAYFDMTEDVRVTAHVKELASRIGGWFMPQCGLAPGVVSIIAANLVRKLGDATNKRVEIRVGALPRSTNNHAKYYLTWSSEGLINEYNNPCHAIVDGRPVDLLPLEGQEQVTIDGATYEAFNTSGGLGTLRETMAGVVDNLNYKTMRYPGHRDYFHFLMHDLGLSKRMPLLVDVLNQEVPHVTDDVIVIAINASGKEQSERGWIHGEQYHRKIYGQHGLSAIQLTTAAGLCVAVDWWAHSTQPHPTGFCHSEDIPWEFFTQSPFSQPYLS